jgi:2-polyprenyl-3-methyl-5-hydroxy-6-metoxy-1,4-benzoquinol methylase
MASRATGRRRRLQSPAAERNRGPILEVLRRVLPLSGTVLEIAAGSGQHAVWFARALPGIDWQPSDVSAEALASIAAWRDEEGPANLRAPVRLDVTGEDWPEAGTFDAIFCANMIHIAPWQACLGLLRGAGRHLSPRGTLVLYGPFRIAGEHTAPSNAAFDLDLRRRDPSWGVRDLDEVAREAERHGLVLEERVAMPANNQTVVFRAR